MLHRGQPVSLIIKGGKFALALTQIGRLPQRDAGIPDADIDLLTGRLHKPPPGFRRGCIRLGRFSFINAKPSISSLVSSILPQFTWVTSPPQDSGKFVA